MAAYASKIGQVSAMKIIFLDIDGVLNCDKTPNPRKFRYVVDKKLLRRFNELLERTKAKVVLPPPRDATLSACWLQRIGVCHSSTFARIGPKIPAGRKC